MIRSQLRSLLLVGGLCALALAMTAGPTGVARPPASPADRPASRPAAQVPVQADVAAWHRPAPASDALPQQLALPAELLAEIREQFQRSLADRRERYAVLALLPETGAVRLIEPLTGGPDRVEQVANRHQDPLPEGWTDIGDFHTHPAAADAPGHLQGFSPADIEASLLLAAGKGLGVFLLADAGRVWMMVRTQETMPAWPAVQEFLERPNLPGFLAAADLRAGMLDIPPQGRAAWANFHAGLSFNLRAAGIRRLMAVYFDSAGRRHQDVLLGGYGLYVGDLGDGVLVRYDR